MNGFAGDTLQFNKREDDIIEDFEKFFDNMVISLNSFNRPEFSNIKIISKKRYEEDLEEEAR